MAATDFRLRGTTLGRPVEPEVIMNWATCSGCKPSMLAATSGPGRVAMTSARGRLGRVSASGVAVMTMASPRSRASIAPATMRASSTSRMDGFRLRMTWFNRPRSPPSRA
ncbi:hypothetical protein D3C80_907850 [compost metagenome]